MIGMVKKRINDLEIEKAELERQIDTRPTLRDQFAMAALTGIIASGVKSTPGGKVDAAYFYADLMLLVRDEEGD